MHDFFGSYVCDDNWLNASIRHGHMELDTKLTTYLTFLTRLLFRRTCDFGLDIEHEYSFVRGQILKDTTTIERFDIL